MSGVLTIQLRNVRLIAAHGLYEGEAQLGSAFEVDVSVSYKAPKEAIITIDNTIDYVKVYQLVQEVMQVQQGLLETCAQHIIERIQQQFDFVKKVSVTIRKLNAPIINFSGTVGVTYTKKFK
jgi:dihydroneopterin aldolase